MIEPNITNPESTVPRRRSVSMAVTRATSILRITILRVRFGRRVVIGRRTLVDSGCRITVAPGGTLVLDGSHLNRFVSLEVSRGGRLEIGSSFIGVGSMISAHQLVRIGDGCQMAEYTSIRDHNHIHDARTPLHAWAFTTSPIVISDNVWIGSKVTVTAGVTIGENATCGAGAVVTRAVAVGTTVAGVPARPVIRAACDVSLPQQRQATPAAEQVGPSSITPTPSGDR